MKISVKDAVNSHQSLLKFGDKSLPMNVSLCVARNQKALNDAVAEFEKRRDVLLEKFGERDVETGNTLIKFEDQKKFNAEMEKLTSEELDLPLEQIALKDLGDDFEAESNGLKFILWMFKGQQLKAA